MLTFRRALALALCMLVAFFVIRNATHATAHPAYLHNSPKPTGSYSDNKKLQDMPPEQPSTRASVQTSSTSTVPPASATWEGDDSGRPVAKKPQPQMPLEDLRALPLRSQLAYAFPYDVESKFPAYIWQTWKTTPASGEFEEGFRVPEASWSDLHPSFVHEVITDDVAVHLIRHLYATIPEVIEAYNALPEPVLKADFFRYLVLLARGGIYSDIDTTALKSAVEWVPANVPRTSYGLVVGIEADPDRPDWQEWYSRRIQFCQWTIQSKPGHPVLIDVVAHITEETMRRRTAGELSKVSSVIEFTGPAVWTDSIFKFLNDPDHFDMSTSSGNITWQDFTGMKEAKKVGDVIVLPITSFSPGVGQMGAGDDDDPMAFVKHSFEGSWKPESERHIGS
ncbi:glycosyltransferase family 32 protein [Piedraia hortae CBS 480.64]|uniref:Glycosyltransferase family 32 protein n=1 Tax=Piedraia hortae CBS 480.64 TaxID=1314780 RepID=A0A6A7BVF0_9PEZI|nr:glycosyltransferase family 32 protein [Piedraia hortae CBS 480.64]